MTPERWLQLKQIFQSALEREPAERSAFLNQACACDAALRSEVESLIASHDQAGDSIEAMAVEAATEMLSGDQTVSIVGKHIGHYQVLNLIGRGGMGMVYLAERADGQYRKKVAIKLIRRGMDADFIIRRFRNERQILADLDHPNIARLLDGGATEDGLPYFVMEYIDGMPVDLHCDTKCLPTRERLKLFQRVCSAVHYAHQRSIVHRDIKPSNILVTADGTPKLLDFGIAKLFDPELSSDAIDSTATTLGLMTPEYASPEQIRGEPITPASDLYTLGVLLYKLLTGHRPYRIRTRQPHEIARVICEEEPEKPSTAVARAEEVPSTDGKAVITLTPESVSKTRDCEAKRLRRLLSGDVDSIVLMAMRKRPDQRYASVEEFSDDIGRHLAGMPVIARKQMRWRLRGKLSAQWKAASAVILLVLLLLVGARLLIRSTDSKPQAVSPSIKTVAVLPLRSLDPNEDQSLGLKLTDALIQRLGRLRQIVVRPTSSVQRYESKTLDPLAAGREQQVDFVLDGSFQRDGQRLRLRVQLLRVGDGQQLWAKALDEQSADPFYLQDALADQAAQALVPQLTGAERKLLARRDTENVEANRLYTEGRYYWNKRTQETAKRAIDYFQQAIDLDANYALAYAGLADSYIILGVYSGLPAQEAFTKAEAMAQKALQLDESLTEAHTALAYVKFRYDWDWPGAEDEYRRAIELNPNYATAYQWAALNLAAVGRLEEAISQTRRAEELDPLSLIINSNTEWVLYLARKNDEAIAHCRKTLEIDPSFFATHKYLGLLYVQKRMYEQAIAEYQKARDLSVDDPHIIALIGHCYALAGKPDRARAALKELQGLAKRRYVQPYSIAVIYTGLGEKDQALAWLEKAYDDRSSYMVYLKVEPIFDSLHSEPRFKDLLRRVALAE
ncbi:MAG: protein kinase [Acidobacteriota bacterium]|nr:protein kinase [Acidobacteriota bacterium]